MHLWRSGVALENFSPQHASTAMRRRLSRNRPDLPVFIHVGRVCVEKNSDMLSKIINGWHAKHGPDTARFAVVGDGPWREQEEAATEGEALWTGFLSGEELWSAFASADVFFSPSTTGENCRSRPTAVSQLPPV